MLAVSNGFCSNLLKHMMFLFLQHDKASHFDLRRTPSICNAFRTFVISEADTYAVIFVSLVSFGFRVQDAASTANKIKMLYLLCEQRLSKQAHYHFRLKNISCVLQALRSLKSKSFASGETADLHTIVVTVLRQVNILQLIPEDVSIFMSLLAEMFPGLSNGIGSRASDIEIRVRAQTSAGGLCQTAVWIDAVLELYEICMSRQTLIFCGPSCSGKTSMLATLSGALASSGQKQQVHRIYPKAMSVSHLFGWFAPETNQWHDGIFSALWRNRAMKDDESSSWISFDGPIDPVWMEGLHSVLDEQVIYDDVVNLLYLILTLH
jgi:dynein heavy chain